MITKMMMSTYTRAFDVPADIQYCCPCGARFEGLDHFHRRNNKHMGSVILCTNTKCHYYLHGFIGEDHDDVAKAVRKMLSNPQ